MLRLSVLAAFFAAVTFDASVAQGPTAEQRDAMRAACRSDFMANCSGVEPGGKEALECLVRNPAKLSAPCKSAVSAAAPASAPAAATAPAAAPAPEVKAPAANAATTPPPTTEQDQLSAVRRACTLDDFVAHCSWIQPSSPEVLLCLKANAPDLSAGCQTVVQSLPPATPPTAAEAPMTAPAATPTTAPAAPAAPAPAARASAPAPAAPTPKPSAQEIGTIRAACRSDFIERCRGVQPGGSAAVACLKRNAARLSPSCRSALAAVGGGAPAAASAAPAGRVRQRHACRRFGCRGATQRRPDQRDPRRLPVGFHDQLSRRAAGRQRRGGMPQAQCGGTVVAVPERARGRRWRRRRSLHRAERAGRRTRGDPLSPMLLLPRAGRLRSWRSAPPTSGRFARAFPLAAAADRLPRRQRAATVAAML